MRPSQYHYIKRIWTRCSFERERRFLCSVLSFPFKIIGKITKYAFILLAISVAFFVGAGTLFPIACLYFSYKICKKLLVFILAESPWSDNIKNVIDHIFAIFKLETDTENRTFSENPVQPDTQQRIDEHTALLYGAMCEKLAKEQEYMERLGIDSDSYVE